MKWVPKVCLRGCHLVRNSDSTFWDVSSLSCGYKYKHSFISCIPSLIYSITLSFNRFSLSAYSRPIHVLDSRGAELNTGESGHLTGMMCMNDDKFVDCGSQGTLYLEFQKDSSNTFWVRWDFPSFFHSTRTKWTRHQAGSWECKAKSWFQLSLPCSQWSRVLSSLQATVVTLTSQGRIASRQNIAGQGRRVLWELPVLVVVHTVWAVPGHDI